MHGEESVNCSEVRLYGLDVGGGGRRMFEGACGYCWVVGGNVGLATVVLVALVLVDIMIIVNLVDVH